MKPLRDAMRREAGWVWREKARAASLGLFLNEETITETLLLRLASAGRGGSFEVYPFTKAEEAKIGADWEFWFTGGAEVVGLRVQAKRLFPSGRYDSLEPGGKQTSDLIRVAAPCAPVFVFYNDATFFNPATPACTCRDYRGQSYRGCIVASAEKVQKAASADPDVIRRFAMPWHCLLCACAPGASTSPANAVLKNLDRLGDVAESTEKEAHDLLLERIRSLASRASMAPPASPDWLDNHLTERKLAGLAFFIAKEAEPAQ